MPSSRRELRSTLDVRDIPEGWVRLSSFGAKSDVRYSAVYAALHNGRIGDHECIKFQLTDKDPRGPIYVCPHAADRAIKAAADHGEGSHFKPSTGKANSGQIEAAVIALCEINNGIALMQATLERLTLAVESIATQPKTAHDRLLATVDGNGFHN